MRMLVEVTKALSDESRVRIVNALQSGELCVCQVTELLELAPSTVSKHLAILRHAGIIEARKDGRWVYCRLARGGSSKLVRRVLTLVREALRDDDRAGRDRVRLEEILELDPEVLCCQQRKTR